MVWTQARDVVVVGIGLHETRAKVLVNVVLLEGLSEVLLLLHWHFLLLADGLVHIHFISQLDVESL